ncbi:hypothetical protein CMALT430_240003 [Carnobacterium maltaromaticum]|nr:hypothetical protein CMALT430_240003 [Carnobacterium maltaromaticum]
MFVSRMTKERHIEDINLLQIIDISLLEHGETLQSQEHQLITLTVERITNFLILFKYDK